jgi:uncharacterized protein (TIGR02391 family)
VPADGTKETYDNIFKSIKENLLGGWPLRAFRACRKTRSISDGGSIRACWRFASVRRTKHWFENSQHVKNLFDDGHYALATFEAYKLIDKEVSALAKVSESGVKLMMKAFSEQSPLIRLTDLSTTSEKDEQEGYKFIFSGSVMAIRNPRGHEYGVKDSPTECLDHLSLASMLLRRLERAK